jgi:capsular exopolysaccharide synthesis family protein
MSKFYKALQQARRDEALRGENPLGPLPRPEVANEPVRLARPSVTDVSRARSTPTSSVVPTTADEVDEHLVSLVTPAAFEAEQYRALRHIIEQLHRDAHLQVIAVSSPATGDGKTITAVNLAGALAQSPEARVLLVEADLRRPTLGPLLNLADSDAPDLVSAIVDPKLTLEQIARPRPPFNLSVICATQALQSPYEILKSPRLGELMEGARRQYDYIVVDTPPLVPIQDCRVIGRWVDGFLVVVAAHRTPRRLVEEALTTLDQTKVLGFVFNQDDRSVSKQYFRHYGSPLRHRPAVRGPLGMLRRVAKMVGDSG